MAITPKAIQDLLDELESSKQSRLRAWSVLQRLRMGSLGAWKRRDSAACSEDIRRRERGLGTCLGENAQDSKRSDQNFVLLGTPLPRRHHQGGMQKRLSPRSSGFVESVGSGRRSDSELSMCGRYRRTTAQEELARRYHISIPPQRDLPIRWNIAPAQDVLAILLNPKPGSGLWTLCGGPDSELGQRSKNRVQDHQR